MLKGEWGKWPREGKEVRRMCLNEQVMDVGI